MNSKINTICYLSMTFLGIYISTYQSVINIIAQNFAISGTIIGIIIALHFAGSFIASAIFGEISAKIGKKAVVLLSYIVLVLGLLAVYSCNILLVIAIAIFIIGCSFGVVESMLSALLADLNPERTNYVISISQMYFCIGAISGPLLSISLTGLTGNWKAMFLFSAIAFTVLFAFFLRMDFPDIKSIPSGDGMSKRDLVSIKLLKEKPFIILCISIFIYVGIEEVAAFWTTTYYQSNFGAGNLGAYALSGYWGSMIVGRYIGSKFEEKGREFVLGGLLISFVSLTCALLIKNSIFNFICFIMLGFGFSVIWPILMAITAKKYPKHTGTAFGIMMTFSAAGGILLPMLTGTLESIWGIGTTLWIIPVMIFILLIIQQDKALTSVNSRNVNELKQ